MVIKFIHLPAQEVSKRRGDDQVKREADNQFLSETHLNWG
jgi:hypothetical protein